MLDVVEKTNANPDDDITPLVHQPAKPVNDTLILKCVVLPFYALTNA